MCCSGKKLNVFYLRCLRRILGIRCQDRVLNTEVLERAGLPSIFTLLSQRRLRWLGHVRRMDDGRIPKNLLYGELASGSRSQGRLRLRYKDTCKRDMKCNRNPVVEESCTVSGLLARRCTIRHKAGRARPYWLPKEEESRPQVYPSRTCSDSLHLSSVQQRLPLPHRPTQPHEEVQKPDMTNHGAGCRCMVWLVSPTAFQALHQRKTVNTRL